MISFDIFLTDESTKNSLNFFVFSSFRAFVMGLFVSALFRAMVAGLNLPVIHYFKEPLNSALRFSRNALVPSLASGLA